MPTPMPGPDFSFQAIVGRLTALEARIAANEAAIHELGRRDAAVAQALSETPQQEKPAGASA